MLHRLILPALLLLSVTAQAADPEPAVRVETLAKATASWDGATLPAYPAGQPEVTILRLHIAPGTELPRHYHPVINAGVVISGTLTVVLDDGRTLTLTDGQAIVEVVETWHYGRNDGPEPVDIIVFYAGVAGQAVTHQ